MKRITTLSFTFLFACLLGACSGEDEVTCDVTWSDADDNELGSATLVYPGQTDVNAGVDDCEVDQATHDDRPVDTNGYSCDCST